MKNSINELDFSKRNGEKKKNDPNQMTDQVRCRLIYIQKETTMKKLLYKSHIFILSLISQKEKEGMYLDLSPL